MSIPCDLVLLPSKELADKAIEVSGVISQHYDSFFTLKYGEFYPHMSLYMFQLDGADIPRIEEVLTQVANATKAIRATATNYSLGPGFRVGYVDPEYEASNELKTLQDKVVDTVNPIRAGMRESDIAKMQDATGIKLENLEKYGYPAIGELFRPHVTLTRLKEHVPEVLELLPEDIATFSGLFDRIGLFEMGVNGTCVREIATRELA